MSSGRAIQGRRLAVGVWGFAHGFDLLLGPDHIEATDAPQV